MRYEENNDAHYSEQCKFTKHCWAKNASGIRLAIPALAYDENLKIILVLLRKFILIGVYPINFKIALFYTILLLFLSFLFNAVLFLLFIVVFYKNCSLSFAVVIVPVILGTVVFLVFLLLLLYDINYCLVLLPFYFIETNCL